MTNFNIPNTQAGEELANTPNGTPEKESPPVWRGQICEPAKGRESRTGKFGISLPNTYFFLFETRKGPRAR